MTMSQGPWSSDGGEVPMHPLDELWYLQDEGEVEAQGPLKGRVLKEMIQAGSIGAASLVAKVGATQWTAIADVPAFADHLLARGRVPLKYAGFWIRVLAYLIDVVLVYILAIVANVIPVAISFAGLADIGSGAMQPAIVLVSIGATLLYYIYFPSSRWQATPGKRICGIHIIREDGRRVTGALALGRYLSYLISSLPLAIGFLMVAFTEQKQGLHDMICSTRVVYGKL
jgi:uncharacterized RDD family membrane protein YckC